MMTNNRYVQFITSDEKAMSIFNSLEKDSDSRIGFLETENGAKLGPSGTFVYYSLEKQAQFIGLTPCDSFEGLALVYDDGDLLLSTAEPTYVEVGNVSRYGRVTF